MLLNAENIFQKFPLKNLLRKIIKRYASKSENILLKILLKVYNINFIKRKK